jgi:hypothetical protein
MKSAAYMSGHSMGVSFLSLYDRYQSTKTVDVSDVTTLFNLATLASECTTLRSQLTDVSYYVDFANGLITGSQQRITRRTADNVINSLLGLDFSIITDAVKINAIPDSASSVTNALVLLIELLSQ